MKTAQVFLNEILEKVYIFPLSGAPYDTRIALAQLIGVILAKGMLHKPPENSKVKSYSKDEVNSLVQLNSRDSLTTFHLLINFARQRKTLSLSKQSSYNKLSGLHVSVLLLLARLNILHEDVWG